MTLEKARDGRWRMRYYADGTKRGRRVQETLPADTTFVEARRLYKQRLARASRSHAGLEVSFTFAEAAEEYLRLHGPKLTTAGRERAESILKQHLGPVFGLIRLQDITAAEIARYQNARMTGESAARPGTVNRELTVLRAVLNRAERWKLIEKSPLRRGDLVPLDAPQGRTRFFSAEEWSRFSAAFDDAEKWATYVARIRRMGPFKVGAGSPEPRIYGAGLRPDSKAAAAYLDRLRATMPVFKALLYTGSRLGEVIGLRWADVDLARGVLTIRQQKTGRTKHVPISTALRALLTPPDPFTPTAFVFARADRRPFGKMDVQRAFEVARKMAELPDDLSVHTLRHTFASWLAMHGTPLRTIAELLGHADVRMTWRYAHLSPSHLNDAVEAIATVEKSTGRHSGATDTSTKVAR